ncbi:hypothetical protein QVA66_05025 [Staphylococcus chromogenes]|nr:hypothetical protein [Staphylococcus chromogenes]
MIDDEGSVTIEAAVGVGALVGVAALVVAALTTLAAQIQAVDLAGAAARAHAIGEPFTPPRGEVNVGVANGWVQVTAWVPAPLGTMQAHAHFPIENAVPNEADVP